MKGVSEKELICAKNLSLQKDNFVILNGINLRLRQGESLAVTGNSGSGKTSLGMVLAGMLVPSGGILQTAPGLKRKMVFQQDQFISYSGQRSTYYGQRYENQGMENTPRVRKFLEQIQQKSNGSASPHRLEELMDLMQISRISGSRLLELSNGERKRTQLTAALLEDPGLLVLDQPFTGLDAESRAMLSRLLEQQMANGLSLVVICHENHIPPGIGMVLELREGKPVRYISLHRYRSAVAPTIETGEPAREDLIRELPCRKKNYTYIVRMQGVNVCLGGKSILKNVSWEIRQGEQWALTGPNGAGKTTLLSLITADNPQGYANNLILFDRKRGTGESIWDIKKQIGFVSPELHLYFGRGAGIYNTIPGLAVGQTSRYDSLSCMDVLLSGFRDEIGFSSQPTDFQQKTAEIWLSLLNLNQLRNRLYVQTSAGQQRSLLLARALVKSPALLILDEPCQGLDMHQSRNFIRLLNTLCTRLKTTLIYVTHVPGEIPPCVSLQLRLKDGKTDFCGRLDALHEFSYLCPPETIRQKSTESKT